MSDITDLILGALAIVLCGAALAAGGQVIREAWRGAFRGHRPKPSVGADPVGAARERDRRDVGG
jgi:hypothetical protein